MAKGDKGGDKDKTPEPSRGADEEKEVRIYSLATTVNECIIFLEELSGSRLLPIWIGIAEGQAIAICFSGNVLPRPLTHDLLLAAISEFGFEVKKIVVGDIKENTFYAKIHASDGKKMVELDCRPSDAIAIAVRAGCPIMVRENVFARCQTLHKPISEDEVSKFKKDLKSLKPEDIFKDLKKKPEGGEPPPQGKEGGDDK